MGPPVLLGTAREDGEQVWENRLGAKTVMQDAQDTARPSNGAAMSRRGGDAGGRDPAKVTEKLETEGEPVHLCASSTHPHTDNRAKFSSPALF